MAQSQWGYHRGTRVALLLGDVRQKKVPPQEDKEAEQALTQPKEEL